MRSILAMFLFASASVGHAQEPVRVGVLGMDNYQAVAFAQLFNHSKATGDLAMQIRDADLFGRNGFRPLWLLAPRAD